MTAAGPSRGGSGRGSGPSSAARGAFLIGLAVIVGIVGLQILDDNSGGAGGPTPFTAATGVTSGTLPTASTVGNGSSTTSPTQALRPASQVRVKVYNQSPTQGRAQTITNVLKSQGYNMQAPANLSGNRTGSVLECRAGFESNASVLAAIGLGKGANLAVKIELFPSNPPDGAGDADCLVILGS